MKFNINKQKNLNSDLTPLMDIIFLILIFFMVAATFDLNRSLKIELPKTISGESKINKNRIFIEISKDNIISLNGNIIKINELANNIKQIPDYNNISVYILGDKQAYYYNITEILDILNLLNITNISLITESYE